MRCTWMALFLTVVSTASMAQTKKAPAKAPPPPAPAPVLNAPEPAPAPVERHSSFIPPHGSPDGLDFAEGRYGFTYGFPDGGGPFGNGFVGARYFVSRNNSFGAYLLLGNDSAAETSAFGLAGKYTSYFAQKDRVHLFWFGQLSLGQNGGSANKGKDDMLFGFGGGAGLEFALLKDFSVSAEGGLGYNTLPDSKSAFATGTGKLAVNFYY